MPHLWGPFCVLSDIHWQNQIMCRWLRLWYKAAHERDHWIMFDSKIDIIFSQKIDIIFSSSYVKIYCKNIGIFFVLSIPLWTVSNFAVSPEVLIALGSEVFPIKFSVSPCLPNNLIGMGACYKHFKGHLL